MRPTFVKRCPYCGLYVYELDETECLMDCFTKADKKRKLRLVKVYVCKPCEALGDWDSSPAFRSLAEYEEHTKGMYCVAQ